jgi:acetoacetyl-CoA synthetase
MEKCDQFAGVIAIPRFEQKPLDVGSVPHTEPWASFLSSSPPDAPAPPFEQLDFMDPFLVYYSSGTTGIPKAIVHAVGPILLNLAKEGRLHEGSTADSVAMQYTTTGWIMYLANVGQLLMGAHVIMYDGSPFQPDLTTYVKLMGRYKITKLGTSPRWMFELAKNGIKPREVADLSSLRIVTSTGMVLSDQLFEWFYDHGFPPHVHLANVSGGTDIVSIPLPTRNNPPSRHTPSPRHTPTSRETASQIRAGRGWRLR